MLFAPASCNIDGTLYEHIHDVIGDVDVLFLGMECDGAPLSWIYGGCLQSLWNERRTSCGTWPVPITSVA